MRALRLNVLPTELFNHNQEHEMAKKDMNVVSMDMGDYQTEDDMRTMCKAQMIQKDPKRLKACMDMAKKQIAALESMNPDENDPGDMAKDKAAGEKE